MNLSGNPLDYFNAFLGGVGISFTPCVFPLIPVVIAFIGIKAGTGKLKGFTLSLTYVTGVAITYAALGLVATLTGRIFGMISSHPLTQIIAGVLIVFFGVTMLDLFNIPLLQPVKLPAFKERNYFTVLALGLVSGLIVGPCTAPALGAILVYLAAKNNVFYGATLLLSFAYGMGLVLVLAGTFSSLLVSLPKSGKWMEYIKKIGAVVLIAIGCYFIYAAIRRM
jgi:cytochrome c-type biogenesis protein